MNRLLTVCLALTCCFPLFAAQTDYVNNLAPLIDPAKLATLGTRGANSRVQKAVYWLSTAASNKTASATRMKKVDWQRFWCKLNP